jgi:DNA-binding transcriptional LysR family regulator
MLESLQTFIEVAAERSFTAVAKRRDVAVSSITRIIDSLEQELGVRLFARSSRQILLTDAGDEFLPRARGIVADMDEARHTLASLNADPSGALTVTVPAAFGRRHVVPSMAGFLAKYPNIDVEMHVSDQTVDLHSRRVDVAIRIGVLPDSDLVATRLAPIRRLVCASPEYLARRGRPKTPHALLTHNCLTYASAPLPAGWWCFPGVNRNLPLQVHGSMKTDDTDAMLAGAVAGIGITHLSSWMVHDKLATGQLVSLFPEATSMPRRQASAIYAVRMPGRSHTAKAQLFIAHLRDHIGDPPYWDRD